ncbi:hypothetical protein BH11PSE9_BH11PSE9_32750 [soil metagenome]
MKNPSTTRSAPASFQTLNQPARRVWLRALSLAPVAAALAACGGGGSDGGAASGGGSGGGDVGAAASRRWRMGFGGLQPRLTVESAVENVDNFSTRAEMAAIYNDVPWKELLAGTDAETIIKRDQLGLVNLYRAKGLKLLFVADPANGLARESEAAQLSALGRSLTEPAIQQVWQDYVLAAARLLEPDWICLAVETNLIRISAPAALYNAVRQSANNTATALRAAGLAHPPKLMSSVQVETAWGLMPGQNGQFQGIATDRSDFAFTECLGLSSYPYLVKARPQDIPDDWYSRVVGGSSIPTMVSEGGWNSATVSTPDSATLASSPELQREYIDRQAQLLDSISAVGWVQLYFADLDLSALQPSTRDSLKPFAYLGLTDSDFKPKSALSAWDALHARPLA